MQIYIAFLRGINVSGQKLIKMAELRKSLENEGFVNVATYIQSGNLCFQHNTADSDLLEDKISARIKKEFGFQVPVMVKTVEDLEAIINDNPFSRLYEKNKLYFTLLYHLPNTESIQDFEKEEYINEKFKVGNKVVYLLCEKGYGKAKLNNNLIERKLGVEATTRNLNTLLKMVRIGSEQSV